MTLCHRFARGILILLTLAAAAAADEKADPTKGAVPLPALAGWRAHLVIDNDSVGIWTVKPFPIFDAIGSEEVVGLDDRGRCRILIPYSGRWTPLECVHDGAWLGGLAHGDIDPRVSGRELYTGGKRGNLFQVVSHQSGTLESRLVCHLPGREIHTLVAGDLDPQRNGRELLVFTWPGGLYLVTPSAAATGGLETVHLQDLKARIRDAVVLPAVPGKAPRVATVSRGGRLDLLELTPQGPRWTNLHRVETGMGRIAMRPHRPGAPIVLYTVCDDGRVYRFERKPDDSWTPELIYAGPLGARGVAAGRFDADPERETVAVFGYSRMVQILARDGERWTATTIFEDRDKGHWLAAAELDGRNTTSELLCCGYGGRIVALFRPPGYGRPGVLAHEETGRRALRIGIGAVKRDVSTLTPFVYFGGFRPKTLVYETLVTIDERGRPGPGLAERWERSEDGKRYVFQLRPKVRFHDGTPCDAAAVKAHFDRWLGRPEHAWIGASSRLEEVRVLDPLQVEFVLGETYPLPRDLAIVNPVAVTGPAAAERGDGFSPVGTGPYRVLEHEPRAHTLLGRFEDYHGSKPLPQQVELRFLHGGDNMSRSHIRALLAGTVDLVADGWAPQIPRDEASKLAADEEYRLAAAPGSLVVFLDFNRGRAPFSHVALRRRVARTVDREELVLEVEHGYADPVETLFARGVANWPRHRVVAETGKTGEKRPETERAVRAVFLVFQFHPEKIRAALAIARQLRRAGFAIDVQVASRTEYAERLRRRDYDLVLSRTHGLPYDPHAYLVARFLPREEAEPAYSHPELTRAIQASFLARDDAARRKAYRAIEAHLEREAVLVPLYAPHRLALMRREVEGFRFGPDGYHLDLSTIRLRSEPGTKR